MSTRYRVSVRRDEFIEWIKNLLMTPFVLHAHLQPAAEIRLKEARQYQRSLAIADARRRYAEIWFDIEALIQDHRRHMEHGDTQPSKLKVLVPSIGEFFTDLPLRDAFLIVDQKRFISSRRFVAPSFNDIRHVLSVAQLLAHARSNDLKLITFDGDLTLYEHGQGIEPDSEILPLLLDLLKRDIRVVILTAAGYPDKSGQRYKERFHGLLDGIRDSQELTDAQRQSFAVLGGECNYLFKYCEAGLQHVADEEWMLDEMKVWRDEDITKLLNLAESVLRECIDIMSLPAQIIRKQRSVGLVPTAGRLTRETLEEVVLAVQRTLQSQNKANIPFCAFNDCDVWVDIGDKALGARCLQKYFGGILPRQTLHCGDQYNSSGNDIRTRTVATGMWVGGVDDTVNWLGMFREMSKHDGAYFSHRGTYR
ncbi:IMP-specific 5-nucleotidase [Protomyces lactucae-debilis]|uniref:IMP-specific 5'-nucleotidase 1 n=1 Tax=Protomyces lactucae-debilis TaxID=2754530 RepID=A0A1Y2F7E7_PROLT|nr:IMP-specific 5-nucleotidase [Protomyces lactucae-debilis]ORY79850.1 IMP-specific 5-nucleotidase [Protomyces lactucae-debilis]